MNTIQYGVVGEVVFLVIFYFYKDYEVFHAFIVGVLLFFIIFILNKILSILNNEISCTFEGILKVDNIGCSPALIGFSYGFLIYSVIKFMVQKINKN